MLGRERNDQVRGTDLTGQKSSDWGVPSEVKDEEGTSRVSPGRELLVKGLEHITRES